MARPEKDPSERRKKLSVRLAPELYEWIEEHTGPGKRFHNKTHALETGIRRLMEEEQEEGE